MLRAEPSLDALRACGDQCVLACGVSAARFDLLLACDRFRGATETPGLHRLALLDWPSKLAESQITFTYPVPPALQPGTGRLRRVRACAQPAHEAAGQPARVLLRGRLERQPQGVQRGEAPAHLRTHAPLRRT